MGYCALSELFSRNNVQDLHLGLNYLDLKEHENLVFKSACFTRCVLQVVIVPKCYLYDGVMKMDVILFGETMPSSTLQDATQAAVLADVLLVVGTSFNVCVLVCSRDQHAHIPNLV